MILGGPSGVRAYPVGEAAGPQGHVFNLELRYRLGPQWLITPFYDRGRIEKRTAETMGAYSLEGAGVSVSWTGPGGWTARAVYARRMGSNPNANTTTGQDQDGSLRKDRLWLTVSRSL
jgi:hemolysin activation/secretion protein